MLRQRATWRSWAPHARSGSSVAAHVGWDAYTQRMSEQSDLLKSLVYRSTAELNSPVQPYPAAVAERASELVAVALPPGHQASTDAIAAAASLLPASLRAADRWQIVSAVELMADRIARSRHPRIAGSFGPTDTAVPWFNWQSELEEPWPILADCAAVLGRATPSLRTVPPGSWVVDTQH